MRETCIAVQVNDNFALVIYPFVCDPPCGDPAVDFHETSAGRVSLCARHWDEYQRWLWKKKRENA